MMNEDGAPVGARVKALLAERLQVAPDVTAINDDSALADLGLDSTAILNLVVGLEDEFDIEIPDRDINPDNFSRVGAINRYVTERLAP
jgi:acyl carrier protein